MIEIKREHEICMGHRVYGHESKCKNLHGHNYKFEFTVRPKVSLDSVGRVVDFSEVKTVLCQWLEANWDHKTLLYEQDPLSGALDYISAHDSNSGIYIISVPFNPTAENIANHFLNHIAIELCKNRSWYLYAVNLHETSKCSAYVCLTPSSEKIIQETKPLVPMPELYYCTKQCGNRRECMCAGLSDNDKKDCRYCVNDLPF